MSVAQELEASGRIRDAVEVLTIANREQRDRRYECELVRLRHHGFDRVHDEPLPSSTTIAPARLTLVDGVPEVSPGQLDVAALRAAIAAHGCLLVRGLVPPLFVDQLVDGIDRAFGAYDAWETARSTGARPEPSPWFHPFRPSPAYRGRGLGGRTFTRSTGGIYSVDSPRMLFELTEMFGELGVGQLVTDHMGERPALSAAKCNVRRTPVHIPGAWHQDGSFIGTDVSTIDVWIALSDCGRDAPGLEIVPRRFDRLLETGADGVVVSPDTVAGEIQALGGPGIVSPEFAAGDAMLFDHLFLHTTSVSPSMTRERYALETWFFAPSRYPSGQIPVLY